jgi:hypothetical protein
VIVRDAVLGDASALADETLPYFTFPPLG